MSATAKEIAEAAEVKRALEYPNGASRDPEAARAHALWASRRGRRRGPLKDDRTPDVLEEMEGADR